MAGQRRYPLQVLSRDGRRPQFFLGAAREGAGAVVFAGDSLTRDWKDLAQAPFPDMKVANRGINGDVSRSLRFRFQEDVLDLNPKAVVILIATTTWRHGSAAMRRLTSPTWWRWR